MISYSVNRHVLLLRWTEILRLFDDESVLVLPLHVQSPSKHPIQMQTWWIPLLYVQAAIDKSHPLTSLASLQKVVYWIESF